MKENDVNTSDTVYKSRKVEAKKVLLLRRQPKGVEFIFVCPEEAETKGAEDFNKICKEFLERIEDVDGDDGDGDDTVWWEINSCIGIYRKLGTKLEEEEDSSKRKVLLEKLVALAEKQLVEHTEEEAGKLLAVIMEKELEWTSETWKPNEIIDNCESAECPLEYILVDCAAETHIDITNRCVARWMNTFAVKKVKTVLEKVKQTGYWDDIDCHTCYRRAAKKSDIETMKRMDATLKAEYPNNELAREICDSAVDTPLPAVITYLCEIDDSKNTFSSSMAWRCIDKGKIELLEQLEKLTKGKLNLATKSFLRPAISNHKLPIVKWLVARGATFLDWKGAVECSEKFVKDLEHILINSSGYFTEWKNDRKDFLDFLKSINGFPEKEFIGFVMTIKGFPEKLKDLC